MPATTSTPSYRGFLSYSHSDKACADWLHRALETYRLPTRLAESESGAGAARRLSPIFRDRAELPAADDLGTVIKSALAASGHLIVICSPAAARSRWVDQEVTTFKRLHGEKRILALIASGEPGASAQPETADQECFPPSLRVRFDAYGQPTSTPAEPIAADIRPGKDGRRLALLKLVAGLSGVGLDDLVQRDAQRRIRRLTAIVVGAVSGMVLAVGLALYANQQRIEADRQRAVAQAQRTIAERESAAARSAADFLIGTFALSNPATENPRTITALTILDRGAARARTELAGQPVLETRLAATLGRAYSALGLLPEAKKAVLASRGAISRAGADGADAVLRLADIHYLQGDTGRALALAKGAGRQLARSRGDHARLLGLAGFIEGRAYAARSDVASGVEAFDRSIAAYGRARDGKPDDAVLPLSEKGVLLSDDGQFAAADQSLVRALGIARRTLGDGHRVTATVWVALARNAHQQGKYDLAAQRLAPAPATLRKVLDRGNPILADAILMQGQIELGQKRFDAATRSLTQAIGIYRAAYRKPNYVVGVAEVYLALAEGGRRNLPGALAAFDRAKVEYDGGYGETHANHGDLLVNRATVLATFGRRRQARADCTAGLAILNKTLGPQASYARSMADTCAALKVATR